MSRLLVIPAAGLGSRLLVSGPKALVMVNGRPMLDHVLALYEPLVAYTVVVAHPSFAERLEQWADDAGCAEVVVQHEPTGMLDAVLLAASAVSRLRPDSIWVTWCDQVGILPQTVQRLAEITDAEPPPSLALPTVVRDSPYIHFARGGDGRISEVLHRREGDAMPPRGEGDVGLFALSRDAFDRDLQAYAREAAPAAGTRERNFLPFIPWLARRRDVVTFPCTDSREALGINTPEDLQQVESWLRDRTR
jgi:bifunctional N-acetylglucosamine-1-phosphate-uridyltransferase/glucosamine-1-phosphate-acetyltransferase GlmU-like protein